MVQKDPNAVVKIYPTLAGEELKDFYSDNNLGSNKRFNPDGNLQSDGGGVYHLTDYSQVRMYVYPKDNYPVEAIGKNNNDFGDDTTRGYATTKDDWFNIEATIYIKMSSGSPTDAELIQKGPTGRHTDPQPDCQGSSYGVRTGRENPTNSEFFKETWHVNYASRGFKNLSSMGNFQDNNWHGLKYMNYEIMVNGKKCRKLEHWLDKNADQNWVKVNETIDQGGWGTGGDDCGGKADQILNWGMGGVVVLRTDFSSGNLQFKWISVREIDVNGDSGGTGGGNDGGGPSTGGGGTGSGNQTVGKDGVAFVYQNADPNDVPNPFVWYMDGSKPFDGNLERGGGSDYSKLVKNDDGSWKPDIDKTTKFNILVEPGKKDATGACKMNFADSVDKGFTTNNKDIGRKGVEMTGFFRMTSPVTNQGIYMRGPWAHHPASNGLCCQEAEYDVEVKPDGSFKFTKELQGEIADPRGVQQIPGVTDLTTLGWFGLKYIFILESNDKGKLKIRLELWFNKNGDKKTWVKVGEAVDEEGVTKWGEKGAVCGGDSFQVYAWGNRGMVIKWYNGHIDFKLWSVREIDDNRAPDENPTEPPGEPPSETEEIIGTVVLAWDINVSRTAPCNVAGSTPSGEIYREDPDDASDGEANACGNGNRTGVYEYVRTSASAIHNLLPRTLKVWMKRFGSPTGTMTARHRTASASGTADAPGNDDAVKQTFGTIDVSTIDDTQYVLYTFGPISNTTNHNVTGNKLGVEYSGGDANNYILVRRNNPGHFDGSNTCKITKEGGKYVVASSMDMCGTIES